jgi:hypothetical protein
MARLGAAVPLGGWQVLRPRAGPHCRKKDASEELRAQLLDAVNERTYEFDL